MAYNQYVLRMKYLKITAVFILICGFTASPHKPAAAEADAKMKELLAQKDYFRLRECLQTAGRALSEERLLYYKAFVSRAFNDSEGAEACIHTLLSRHRHRFAGTVLLSLLDLRATNYIYMHRYRQASDVYSEILHTYAAVLDSSEIDAYQNVKNLFASLANVEPQRMHRQGSREIASYRNTFGHLMLPVKAEGGSAEFILDTGANLSTIAESEAKRMKLTLLEQVINVGSSTRIDVHSKLAVADSFYVGDILFENVVFLVMPDEQLTFAEIGYKINGIVGFPVMLQLEELHLHKNGRITVPGSVQETALDNMALEGLNPVVRLYSGSDTLLFTFDTGAQNSELSFKYYREHKDNVEKYGRRQLNTRGGAGGQTNVEEYMLSDFPIRIGLKNAALENIPVSLEEYAFNKYFDGNLGQDVITQFNTLVMNFKYMYINFE